MQVAKVATGFADQETIIQIRRNGKVLLAMDAQFARQLARVLNEHAERIEEDDPEKYTVTTIYE